MTSKQKRFKDKLILSLSNAERYLAFWDFEKRELLVEKVAEAKNYLSDGEVQMLYFLCNVWLGENRYPFDLFYSASKLDNYNRIIVSSWLEDPFWP